MKGRVTPDIMNLIFLQILYLYLTVKYLFKFIEIYISEEGNKDVDYFLQ